MKQSYYPPIPGKIGHRGRPSREEMEERKLYWENDASKLSGNIIVQNKETHKEIQKESFEVSKRATPKTINNTETTIEKNGIPKEVQDIINNSPIPLTKEEMNKIHDLLVNFPPVKRGRMSQEDYRTKVNILQDIRSIIAGKIQLSQGIESIAVKTEKPVEVITSKSGSAIDYPQFKPEDSVKRLPSTIITDLPETAKRGTVFRHDLGSRFVFVRWNDGSAHFAAANTIVKYFPELEPGEDVYNIIRKYLKSYRARVGEVIKISEIHNFCNKFVENNKRYNEIGFKSDMIAMTARMCFDENLFINRNVD